MYSIDVQCCYTSSFIGDGSVIDIGAEQILLGRQIHIALSFILPTDFFGNSVKKAMLILSKIPIPFYQKPCDCADTRYNLYPLCNGFGLENEDFCKHLDKGRKINFCNQPCSQCTEIDVTSIANAWLKGFITNRNLVLIGSPYSELVCYASEKHPVEAMHPRIRFVTEHGVPCTENMLAVADAVVKVDFCL